MDQRLRLLIVEDAADAAALIKNILSIQGYTVEHAVVDNAQAMRAALQRQEWDLITSDHSMPGFNAPAALALAREMRPEVPFIIVSGEIDLKLAVSLVKAGANDYVPKSELLRLGAVAERELREARANRERKVAEEKLRETQEIFRAIVENVGDLVAVLDTQGRRLYNNPAYLPLFREDDIRVGSDSFMQVHPEDRERVQEIFHRTVTTGVGERTEFRFVLKDGHIRHMESEGRPVHDADGNIAKVIVVSRDITARKRIESELLELATIDSLTGLFNRRYFLTQLAQELARMQRLEDQRAAVLMLDLDYFKRVNDSYGHATGDSVLKHFAGLLRSGLRKIDTAGRVGGEEFAIILPGASTASAGVYAERLRLKVEQSPLMLGDKTIPLTVSIGVAAMEVGDTDADAALIRADQALYLAKEGGRNRVELSDAPAALQAGDDNSAG